MGITVEAVGRKLKGRGKEGKGNRGLEMGRPCETGDVRNGMKGDGRVRVEITTM